MNRTELTFREVINSIKEGEMNNEVNSRRYRRGQN